MRGEMAVMAVAGRIQVVNSIGLGDWVCWTVGGVMSSRWPSDVVRAQAVTARTYVLHGAGRRRSVSSDTAATEMSQVYRGVDAETKETRSATRATAGQVSTLKGTPILAGFPATAGGRTAPAGAGWGEEPQDLHGVEGEDEDVDAPTHLRDG